jgi:hypothetical protein
MTNLSTLFFLVNTESANDEDGMLLEEINLMEVMDTEPMFTAPEMAVRKILGFAASYSTKPSALLNEVEFFNN